MPISNENMKKFAQLLGRLSPENLYCDGEASHNSAMAKKTALKKEWNVIEKEIGVKVSETEVFDWIMNN